MESIRGNAEPVGLPHAAVIAAAFVAAIAGAIWFFWPQSDAPTSPTELNASRVETPVAATQSPRAHYPVPVLSDPQVSSQPLPALDASDAALVESLSNLLGPQTFAKFFVPESLVRHVVATVDNLPRGAYAQRLNPVNPVGGPLATTGKDANLALAPENAARYSPWVRLVERLDARRIVAIYVHFYPLFQQAYVDLGYPDGYFNNRLVQVIDHLVEAPVLQEPVKLVVRHVLPEFADPELEAASAGRKVLWRMGTANAAIVKSKLREIRRELTERTPSQ